MDLIIIMGIGLVLKETTNSVYWYEIILKTHYRKEFCNGFRKKNLMFIMVFNGNY